MTDERLKRLREYNEEDRVVTSHEMKIAFSKEADNIVNVKSLIPGIDHACDGFREGDGNLFVFLFFFGRFLEVVVCSW